MAQLRTLALAWAGLAIAAIGVLSTFALLTPALDATLPVGRFGGLLWLIAASIALPRTRRPSPGSGQCVHWRDRVAPGAIVDGSST
jgi:hypothetical protein